MILSVFSLIADWTWCNILSRAIRVVRSCVPTNCFAKLLKIKNMSQGGCKDIKLDGSRAPSSYSFILCHPWWNLPRNTTLSRPKFTRINFNYYPIYLLRCSLNSSSSFQLSCSRTNSIHLPCILVFLSRLLCSVHVHAEPACPGYGNGIRGVGPIYLLHLLRCCCCFSRVYIVDKCNNQIGRRWP